MPLTLFVVLVPSKALGLNFLRRAHPDQSTQLPTPAGLSTEPDDVDVYAASRGTP